MDDHEESSTSSEEGLEYRLLEDRNPSEEFDEPWLYAYIKTIREKYNNYPREDIGKWMMFIDNKMIDQKWAEAITHYKEGNLIGIEHMKVSTMIQESSSSSPHNSVLLGS